MARFHPLAYMLEKAADRMHHNLHKHGGSVTITYALQHSCEFCELSRVLARRKVVWDAELVYEALEANGFAILPNPGMKGERIHSLRF